MYHFTGLLVSLWESLLSPKKESLTDLQRLSEKCMSLSLAVAGARLYTNEINTAVSRASKSSRAHPTLINEPLRQEIEHWLFLKSWSGLLPWRSGIHNQFVLHTNVSFFAWGRVFKQSGIPVVRSDYWPNDVLASPITVKEAIALSNSLESFKLSIKDSRVDVYVDSLAQGLAEALKSIFKTTLECNCVLRPSRSLTMSEVFPNGAGTKPRMYLGVKNIPKNKKNKR